MFKFTDYRLYFNNGDKTTASIRLPFNDAWGYYVDKQWDVGVGETEQFATCIMIEELV